MHIVRALVVTVAATSMFGVGVAHADKTLPADDPASMKLSWTGADCTDVVFNGVASPVTKCGGGETVSIAPHARPGVDVKAPAGGTAECTITDLATQRVVDRATATNGAMASCDIYRE
jgi:hypothetical protein